MADEEKKEKQKFTNAKGHPRQCTATSKTTKERCSNFAIKGAKVCRFHGGGSPQVKKKARERIADLVDPAIGQLRRILEKGKDDAVIMRAIKDVLDRAGFKPIEEVRLSHDVSARLIEGRKRLAAKVLSEVPEEQQLSEVNEPAESATHIH